MKPEEYTGSEWQYLLKQMDGKDMQLFMTDDLIGKGLPMFLPKGYTIWMELDTGFMVTVKARAASRKTGKGEKSMHQNRKGFKKPVLMWAEEGTQPRKRGGKRVKADNAHNTAKAQGRIGGAWQYIRKGGIKTGRMKPYRFLERATPEMFQAVEAGLTPEVGRAVENVARKCGFI